MKSNECRSALRKLQHSNPYNSIVKHLDLTSSRITTSEARFSSLPNTPLTAPKNDRFEWLKEHLKEWALTTKIPRYLISETHGKYWPSLVCRLAQLALQRGPIRIQHDLCRVWRKKCLIHYYQWKFCIYINLDDTLWMVDHSNYYNCWSTAWCLQTCAIIHIMNLMSYQKQWYC